MPNGKSTTIKKPRNGKEDVSSIIPTKSKIPLEIEDPDVAHPIIVEEKIEEDPLVKEENSDELESEEATLDEEELNPFGDKWEQ